MFDKLEMIEVGDNITGYVSWNGNGWFLYSFGDPMEWVNELIEAHYDENIIVLVDNPDRVTEYYDNNTLRIGSDVRFRFKEDWKNAFVVCKPDVVIIENPGKGNNDFMKHIMPITRKYLVYQLE